MGLPSGSNQVNGLSPLTVGMIVTFSGFCSLVYQVVWDRVLRYNFGGDSISAAIVTSAFLLGLGIGAFIFGKWRRQAYTTYALVEIGIGGYALISYYILAPMAIILGRIFNYSIADIDGLRYIVVVACILFLLPPCILMGGTLPLMFNCFIRPGAYQNKTIGMIYGLNTAGAAAGILAVPFLFLNHISIPATLLIIGTGNILLGCGVWLYGRHQGAPFGEPVEVQPAEVEADNSIPLYPILALSFVSGFITLSFEISLLRTVTLLARSSPYTFPFVLMPFLFSLAAGSMIFTRFKHYSSEVALRRVGILFILAMLGMLGGIVVRYISPFNLLLLIIPVPLLLGGVFPLLLRLASRHGQELPARTGRVYLVNSVGSFSGAMLAQFYGFPYLGTKGLIIFLFLAGIITGLVCLSWQISRLKTSTSLTPTYLPLFPVLILAVAPVLIPSAAWDVYTFNYTGSNIEKVEGVSGVAVIRWEADDSLGHIEVNGQYMSALPDHPKHVRLESITLAMPHREHSLMLGLGGGGMVRELVNDPEIKQLDVVDWSYELPLVLQTPQANLMLHDALNNPKVRLYRADARVAVSFYKDQTFDMIADNLGYLGWAGSTSIKSTTYFQEIRRILKPGGVFVLDPNYLSDAGRRAILAGLIENFSYVQEHQSGVIIASDQPIEIDPARAEEVLQNRGRILDLSEPYADWLLQGFKPITAQELKNSPPIFDDLLIYEYTIFGTVNP